MADFSIHKHTPPVVYGTVTQPAARFTAAVGLMSHPAVQRIVSGHRPWHKAKYIAQEAGIDPEDAWRAVKLLRLGTRRMLPLTTPDGQLLSYCITRSLEEHLHRVDQHAGVLRTAGSREGASLMTDPEARQRFIVRSLMEEAIESSKLEGASTTLKDARQMLRTGRAPRDRHERMITNNYEAMRRVKEWADRPLSMEMLNELQSIVTRGTLDDGAQAGRLRAVDERIAVWDRRTDEVIYTPPSAESLPERLAAVFAFANSEHHGETFIHPVVKAIVLHFMIGYEHPYCDGNGRTARAVFYWSVLRSGYWLFEFLVISELIRASYAKYPAAYLDAEHDDGDVTYFIKYNLRIIDRAIDAFHAYLDEAQERFRRSLALAAGGEGLNTRQRLALEHAVRHPAATFSARAHATTYQVTLPTARRDLQDLHGRGLLRMHKSGKEQIFTISPDAEDRLSGRSAHPA